MRRCEQLFVYNSPCTLERVAGVQRECIILFVQLDNLLPTTKLSSSAVDILSGHNCDFLPANGSAERTGRGG